MRVRNIKGKAAFLGNVLFVCLGNRDRSPTAERLFNNWNGQWKARSAGTNPVPGGTPVSQALIDWADLVLVMGPEHEQYIDSNFTCEGRKLRVLNIDDVYVRDDPELVEELERKVIPLLRLSTTH